MSQKAAEKTTPAEAAMQSGGQVRPVEPEGTTNGFTAVNGRGSPTSQTSQPVVTDGARNEPSQPSKDPSQKPTAAEADRHAPQTNGTDYHESTPPANSAHKRKRSAADDGDEEEEEEDDDQSSDETVDDSMSAQVSPDVQVQEGMPFNRPSADGAEAWSGQHNDDQAEQLRMLAPIQRENQQHANGNYTNAQLLQNGHGMRPGYHKDETTGLITTNAGVQMDPKKRKRAFTNRTKTGCQTCRRRKKKCDEAKPECNNCTRGGFKCEGYTPKVSWPPENKMKGAKQPIPPVQGGVQHNPRDFQEYSGNLHPRPAPRHEPPSYIDMTNSMQPSMRVRPLPIDDDSERPISNGWSGSPYATSHRGYSDDKGPVHGLPMHGGAHGIRDSYDRPMSSMSASGMHSMPPMHSMQPSPASHGTIHIAQQALRNTTQMNQMSVFNSSPPMDTERERAKMLAGELYMPSHMVLEADRNRCEKALYPFNNNNHQNKTERMRHMKSIVSPEDGPVQRIPGPERVGKGATVDVPFRCEFGYNITIGADVLIESGCYISDPRDITIGSGTYVGPGVKIMGKVYPYDPNVRGGAAIEGKARGFEIHIGKNVHIGANSVIQPEEETIVNGRLEIGDGAFIKPMSIVNKNVPQYVIYGPRGSSCDVISGIITQNHMGDERKPRMR